jgi:branched-subunit amino acid aminotransferase/4-amino-4-deoxychorismate lyase
MEAQAKGAFEPVMLNEIGEVAETASANLFLVKDGPCSRRRWRRGSCPA